MKHASILAIILLFVVIWPMHADASNSSDNELPSTTNAQSKTKIFQTVIIQGSFAEWPDKNHYNGWFVTIIQPSNDRANLQKFPVKEDGSFKGVLHNIRNGDSYYLHNENTGDQRFEINSDHVWIDTIGPNSAG